MKGIEYSLISEWDGWDECDAFDLQFYDVKLIQSAWPEAVYNEHKDGKLLLAVLNSSSTIELYNFDVTDERPVFTARTKLIITEAVEEENDDE